MIESWRNNELSLHEVIQKYPDVSPFVIIKTDVQRRGVTYSEKALSLIDPHIHQVQYSECTREVVGNQPSSFILRDGTSVITAHQSPYSVRTPYLVDVIDNKIYLIDNGEVIEEIFYWEKPKYYDKYTETGKPMWKVVSARPQRLDIYPHHYCEFWNTPGEGCKYCAAAAISKKTSEKDHLNTVAEIKETVAEALKEKGRFSNIFLTAGTILSGTELLDDELDIYIEILRELGSFFNGEFPSQLIGTAYNRRQLERLKNETGLMSYTADIEVLGKDKFEWICPGKARHIGYEGWKNRLYDAVDIFGKGYVNTGLVAGVELATPHGYPTEEEALKHTLEEAENLASHGVGCVACVWTISEGSIFFRQQNPSLDYYIHLAKGLRDLRRKYGISVDMDNYRRCGNHPDTDLSRVDEGYYE